MKTMITTSLVLFTLAISPAFAEGEVDSTTMSGQCNSFNQDTLQDSGNSQADQQKKETKTSTTKSE